MVINLHQIIIFFAEKYFKKCNLCLHPDAECVYSDTANDFECRCKHGFLGDGKICAKKLGKFDLMTNYTVFLATSVLLILLSIGIKNNKKLFFPTLGDIHCWECEGESCESIDESVHVRKRCDVGSDACQMFITGFGIFALCYSTTQYFCDY